MTQSKIIAGDATTGMINQAGDDGTLVLQSGSAGSKVNALVFATNGDATALGAVLSSGVGGIGYSAGAGGSITQATSRTTGVTLNKTTGAITLFSAAGSATAASFTVTNSQVASTDVVIPSVKSATNKYIVIITAVAAGSFEVTFYTTGGTSTDAPVINFTVIKGVAA